MPYVVLATGRGRRGALFPPDASSGAPALLDCISITPDTLSRNSSPRSSNNRAIATHYGKLALQLPADSPRSVGDLA